MNRVTSSVMTALTVGAVAGTASYMMYKNSRSKATMKKFKRNAGHAVSAVGSIIDNVVDMIR